MIGILGGMGTQAGLDFCNKLAVLNRGKIVKPDVINIDYITDPKKIINEIDIPIQGGMDPTILLSGKENIKKDKDKDKEKRA